MAYTDIDDPSAYFQTLLYTGNSANNRALVNDGNSDMQPDFVWIKDRTGTATSSAAWHMLFDSSRGANGLSSNETAAEPSNQYNTMSSFDSDGFTILAGGNYINANNEPHVAWQWKANGGTTTNVSASGSGNTQIIASTHQANTDAGFSMVTFTAPDIGSGNNYTVSHGLGAVPEVIILKSRNITGNWHVYHQATGPNGVTFLNKTDAFYDNIYFADTTPSSTVFTMGARTALDPDNTAVAYCFAEKQGYSKFGSYSGNGNNNGAFVYLGFSPSWLLVKRTNSAESWQLVDNKRSPINVMDEVIRPDNSGAENSNQGGGDSIDFLSNGFKPRSSAGQFNNGNSTYIYMAFAEHPFVSSKGVPTTAR